MLQAAPTVLRVEEQVKVTYELDGIEHVHFMDLRITHRCRKRIAYFVKATEEAGHKADVHRILQAICDRHGSRFADDYRFASFEKLDPVTVLNAKLIARCRERIDWDVRDAVRAVLPGLGRETTAAEIGRATGLGSLAEEAAYSLIPTGVLANRPGRPLGPDGPLTNLLAQGPANQAA